MLIVTWFLSIPGDRRLYDPALSSSQDASSKCWTTWNASPHRLHHISDVMQLESTGGGCAGIIMDIDRINYIFTDLIYFWTLTDLWDWKTMKVLY